MNLMITIKAKCFGLVKTIINRIYPKQSNLLTFIPHAGCDIDRYSIANYKSDSSLTFFYYIVNQYGNSYKYQIAIGNEDIEQHKDLAARLYPDADVSFFYLSKVKVSPLNKKSFFRAISRSKYIFTSEIIQVPWRKRNQIFTYLGYYGCNFKSDLVSFHTDKKGLNEKTYNLFCSSSQLFSYINSPVYNVDIYKFRTLGMTRDDSLLSPFNSPSLEIWLKSKVNYPIKKVFLYTPTHRDYEQSSNQIRDILGFNLNRDMISHLLQDNGIVIICKIHSHQNHDVISSNLPYGVFIHEPNSNYGLCELLQRADCLITDYTSTYFDYLYLDRPVLFNFYDFEKYQKTRGFAFDPVKSIIAGEIFTDEKSFYKAIKSVLTSDKWQDKRTFVDNLVHKYHDCNNCERIYNYIFNA